MDVNKLMIFHEVAKNRSISKTTLDLNPSVISRHIRDLEASLKVKLFLRTPRGLVLTAAGHLLFEQAEGISAQVQQAQQMLKAGTTGVRESLDILMPTSWVSHVVTAYLGDFLEKHPQLSLNIVSDDSPPQLFTSATDRQTVAILPYGPKEQNLVKRFIMPFTLKLYAHRHYLAAHGTPQSLAELDQHRLIASSARDKNFLDLDWHLRAGLATGASRIPVLRINHIFTAVAAGLGIGTLAAENYHLHQADLVPVLPECEGPRLNAYYVYPDYLRFSPAVKLVGDFLLTVAEAYLGTTAPAQGPRG